MNIFENISKEDFIRMYNLYLTTQIGLSTIELEICEFSRNVEFKFTGEKRSINKEPYFISIRNVLNYDTEIEIINSFDVVRDYCGEKIIICDNVNKYFVSRGITKKLTENSRRINEKLKYIQSISKFNTYVKRQEKIKLSKEINHKLLENHINPFKESFIDVLQPKLNFLDFTYNVKTTYSFRFIELESLDSDYKLIKKHLVKNNFLDYFKLNVFSEDKRKIDEIKLEKLLMYKNEFYDCFIETGSYFGYELYGDETFYFKKTL